MNKDLIIDDNDARLLQQMLQWLTHHLTQIAIDDKDRDWKYKYSKWLNYDTLQLENHMWTAELKKHSITMQIRICKYISCNLIIYIKKLPFSFQTIRKYNSSWDYKINEEILFPHFCFFLLNLSCTYTPITHKPMTCIFYNVEVRFRSPKL